MNKQATQNNRIYLQVPKEQKDEAKSLGAKWDRTKIAWYIHGDLDPSPFAAWLEDDSVIQNYKPKKTILIPLTISYDERHIAKMGKAKWDAEKKVWYATEASDLKFLETWIPEKYIDHIPSKDSREAFVEELSKIGLMVEPHQLVTNGIIQRTKTNMDKGAERSGVYNWFENDGRVTGGYGKNHRTGEEVRWKPETTEKYTPQQKAIFNAHMAEKRASAQQEQHNKHLEAAERTREKIKTLRPIVTPTPYVERKKIPVTNDTYTDEKGRITCVPHYDIDGKIWSMTHIFEDGTKKYTKDGRKAGCFHVINGFVHLPNLPMLVVAEGYSTAATLTEALGFSCIAAFDNGNLLAVAQALHQKYPEKPIVIAGDDDRHVVDIDGVVVNPGKTKALQVAEAVNGRTAFPEFTPEEAALPGKEFTDWNDLAIKSSLGREIFLRQVRETIIREMVAA